MKPLHIGFDVNGRRLFLNQGERKTHMHVIGSSDSGKSKFLEWMMRGDLQNRQGFALLDPHGTLYQDVVNFAAHHVLDREIILLDLSQPDSVIGFNPFQRSGEGDVSVQVDNRITATMHAWNIPNTDFTPTLARTLRLIYTIMLEMNLALPQVAHLIDFNAHKIQSHLVEQLQSPLIQKEWRELQALRVKDWRDEVLSAKNKLFKLLTSPTLGRFMGVQGRTLDLKEIMDQGKILLVNLAASDDLSKENARVFGALLVNEFFECALRRQKKPNGDNPTPYYLYMDEFQKFVSLDIADMLDEVRKFGLFQVLAHQRFGQLDENITEAVLVNAKIKAVFGGLTTESAKLMAEELFIGQLDPKKIKVAIYQTKFWPKYQRDKVYTESHSSSSTHATTNSEILGSGSASTSGESFTASDWTSFPTQVGTSSSVGNSQMSASGSSDMYAESEGASESVADIPILIPVPFQELSSVQYYPPEEQLLELTASLKEQYQRHAFIKIQQQETQPMLVPFVETFYTNESNSARYREKQLKKQSALSRDEVDRLLESQETALLKSAGVFDITPTEDIPARQETAKEPPIIRRGRSARAGGLFSKINAADALDDKE
jgi:hypothetical protein